MLPASLAASLTARDSGSCDVARCTDFFELNIFAEDPRALPEFKRDDVIIVKLVQLKRMMTSPTSAWPNEEVFCSQLYPRYTIFVAFHTMMV